MPKRKVLTDWPEATQKQIVSALAPKKAPTATVEQKTEVKFFSIAIEPMGKPRQTQSDKWRKRPCVVRFRQYADTLRASCLARNPRPLSVSIICYFPMPASWSKNKKTEAANTPHRQKPDLDNVLKGVMDSLWENDECIAFGSCRKFWDDGKGARIGITIS